MSKIQIRQGVFETNSSSVHSITMVDKTDFDSWKKGTTLLNEEGDKQFLPFDEAMKYNLNILQEYYLDGEDVPQSFIDEYKKSKAFLSAIDNCDDIELESGDIDLYDIYLSYDEWRDYECEYYETFDEEYKTKHGDEVVAFGYYGHD